MRHLLLCLSLCALAPFTTHANEGQLPKVTYYGLKMQFLLKEHHVNIVASVTVRNTTASPRDELPFLLYRLLSVQMITDAKGTPLEYLQDVRQFSDEPSLQARLITVRLSNKLLPGDSVTIVMTYAGFIFGYPEVMAYVRERIDEAYSLFRPDAFAYPMLSTPSFGSTHAAYDSKFTFDILATVPRGFTAVCGGEMIESRTLGTDSTQFVFRSRVPTWRIDLAVARFSVLSDATNKLFVYHLPEDSAGAAGVLKASQRAVRLYGEMFGVPSRYRGYTIIEIPDGWGSQAGDTYFLQTAAAFKDSSRIGEVYHEIGHTWNVTAATDVKRCRYFDEAFASYFESLALRAFEGEGRFTEDMERSRTNFVQWSQYDRQVYETPIAEYGKKELGRHSYTKGAWSLYVLSRLVGDKMFARIIRTMLEEFESTTINFVSFQRLCEHVSGRDLKEFFAEWVYGSESSKLLVEGVPITDIIKRY